MQLCGFQPLGAFPGEVSAGSLESVPPRAHTTHWPSDDLGDLRITFQPQYLWDKFSLQSVLEHEADI